MSKVNVLSAIITQIQKAEDGTLRFCDDCPIAGTKYCHKLNPMAKKYTRMEKETIRRELDKQQQEK